VEVESARQLALFDEVMLESGRAPGELVVANEGPGPPKADARLVRAEPAQPQDAAGGGFGAADRAALAALEAALADARAAADDRPPLVVLASCLGQIGTPPPARTNSVSLRQARNEWLRRLETGRKSRSTLVAYPGRDRRPARLGGCDRT
jgi:hypothetical protein